MALTYQGNWTLATAYAVDDYVTDVNDDAGMGAGTLIYCQSIHTSDAADLALDWAREYWSVQSGINAYYNNNAADGGPALVDGTLANAVEVEDKFNAVAAGFDTVADSLDKTITLTNTDNTVFTVADIAANRAGTVLGFDTNGDLDLLSQNGTFTGDWASSTYYRLNAMVQDSADALGFGADALLITTVTHTSSAALTTDVANWTVLVDTTAVATSAANAALTAADVITTNADVVLTNADVVTTNADVVLTNADVVITNQDAIDTAADVVLTNADVVTTTNLVASVNLPTVGAGDAGKHLKVNVGETGYEIDATVLVDADLGVSVQAYDVDTSKLDVAETRSATLNMADLELIRPKIKDASMTTSIIGNTGATQTFDYAVAHAFTATLDQASTFTFSNPPATGSLGSFKLFLTNGGAFVPTFPLSVKWDSGTEPTLTTAGTDVLSFETTDAGVTWVGKLEVLAYA